MAASRPCTRIAHADIADDLRTVPLEVMSFFLNNALGGGGSLVKSDRIPVEATVAEEALCNVHCAVGTAEGLGVSRRD